MKMGKRWLALLLCAVMTVSLAACSGPKAASGSQTEADSAEQQGSAQETGTAAENEKTPETAKDSAASMGRYMENSFALPEGAESYGRAMTLLSDGTLAYFDSTSGLSVSKDGGESWQKKRGSKEILGQEDEDSYVSRAAIGQDGSMMLLMPHFSEDSMSTSVICLDAEGNRFEVNGDFSDGDFVARVAVSPDGDFYASSLRGKVCKIDKEAGELKQLFTAAQAPEVMAFSGKLLLALEDNGVEMYHLELKQLQDQDSVLDEFCSQYLSGKLGNMSECVGAYLVTGEEGILYIACSEGVFRHVLGGNAMEQLIEGNFSSFGDPTVSICSVVLLDSGEFLLLPTGEELIRFTYDPDEPTVPEKQLKVYSLEENSRIRQTISVYQKQYPDVYVNYEIGMPQDSAVTLTDALKSLNMELLGGNGPDVLVLDGMDSDLYVQKGMLQDISHILDGLTGENAAFENIAGAYQTENGTYVIPAGFLLPLLLGKEQEISGVKDMASLADLAEQLSKEVTEGTVTGAWNTGQELGQLLDICGISWTKEGELDETALEEFLTQAARIYEADQRAVTSEYTEVFGQYSGEKPFGGSADMMEVDLARLAFGQAGRMLFDMGVAANFLEEKEGYGIRLFDGQNNDGFIPSNKLAIAAGTIRQEEAENFVRLMLSRQIQDVNMSDCFPVNTASFDKMCEWTEQCMGGTWFMPDGEEKEVSARWPKEPTTDRLKELIKQAKRPLEGNAILEEAISKYGAEVLTGKMSAEEGVRQIKREVSIYLSEQR